MDYATWRRWKIYSEEGLTGPYAEAAHIRPLGALILGVLRNGLNLLNVSAFWQQVVIGAVIALAVMTDTLRRRKG